jgi:hypothetical protein
MATSGCSMQTTQISDWMTLQVMAGFLLRGHATCRSWWQLHAMRACDLQQFVRSNQELMHHAGVLHKAHCSAACTAHTAFVGALLHKQH